MKKEEQVVILPTDKAENCLIRNNQNSIIFFTYLRKVTVVNNSTFHFTSTSQQMKILCQESGYYFPMS